MALIGISPPPSYGIDVTPVWTSASGTPPAIGNGTLGAHVLVMGSFIKVDINFVAGSTTTFGDTGQIWGFTLPAPFNGNSRALAFGAGYLVDSSVPLTSVCTARISANGNVISLYPHGAAAIQAAANIPWTWASGDVLRLGLMFELA